MITGFVIFLLGGTATGEDLYVTGITKITMRTGPGVEHKIVAMLVSGTRLAVVEYREDWSQVKTQSGRQGWVLSRFLTKKVPDALLVDGLEKKNQALEKRVAALEQENQTLTVKNATLVQIQEKYNKLKRESGQFLELEARYKKVTQAFEEHKKRMERLEDETNSEFQLWYLIGPGVFIVGFIFGLSTRKKKRNRLL